MTNKKIIVSFVVLITLLALVGGPALAQITITSVSPTTVNVGDTVTISGSGFGANQGSRLVKFQTSGPLGYIEAGVTSWSDSEIATIVPPYAVTLSSGAIKVVSGPVDGVYSGSFTVKPKVTSASASTTLLVVRFDNYMDGNRATNPSNYTLVSGGSNVDLSNAWSEFRGNQAAFRNISLTVGHSFTITVGSSVQSVGGTGVDADYNSASGTVVQAPTITSVYKEGTTNNYGSVGDTVTITGTGFGAAQGQSKVYFSPGKPSGEPQEPIQATTISSWSNTSIKAVIPTGTKTGPVFVVVNGVESGFDLNCFFDIKGNFQFKVIDADNGTDIGSTNARLVIGSMGGPSLYDNWDVVGTTSYSATDGIFTIFNASSEGSAWAFDASGNHLTSTGQDIDTTQTVTFSLDGVTRKISGSITGAGDTREIVIWSDPIEETGTGMVWREPVFVRTDSGGAATYNIGLGAAGKYIVGVEDPGFKTGAGSNPKIAPAPQEVDVSSANAIGVNFAFTAATARIHGKIERAEGKTFDINMPPNSFHVFAFEPKEDGRHAAAVPDNNGGFDLYVNPGIYIVEAGGPGMPSIVETKIEVKDADTTAGGPYHLSNTTTDVTLVVKAPEDYIEGTVKDSSGNGISGASIFAWSEIGPGGGQAFTDSSGYYKLYLSPGRYSLEGFTPQYGKLSRRTGIVVSTTVHPTVDFSISSEMATVSGNVKKNSQNLAGAEAFITEGEFGYGINGTKTDSSGDYSLRVPYTPTGTTYWLHVGQPGKGELYRGAITTTLNSGTTTLTKNVSVNTSTITVKISPKTSFSKAFVGIHGTGSTKGGGFSENDISAAGDSFRQYSIEVPTGTYAVEGGILNYGPLPANMTVNGTPQSNHNITVTDNMTIEFTLGSVYTISGSIADPDVSATGNQAERAWVWAASPTGFGGGEVATDGAFSFKVFAGTYDIGIDKPGYIGSMITGADVTSANYAVTSGSLTLTKATATITGTITSSSGTLAQAWIWATNGTGGWSGDKTNGDGEFILDVGSGDWTIKAVAEGYSGSSSLTVPAGTSGLTITLSAISGYTAPAPKVEPITPKDGGVVQGESARVEAPAGALGTDTSSGWLTLGETASLPSTNSFKPLAGKGITISAQDSSNTRITTLSSAITIEITYTASDLETAGVTQAEALTYSLGYWNSTINTWTAIPTTAVADSVGTGVTYTGTTDHLSDFAPLVPSGANPPDTPTGLTASAGNQQVTLSWSASATKYDIYRKSDSLYPYLAQATTTSYTDTGLTNGTTYYYKVSALNADNDESTAAGPVSATPAPAGGGVILPTAPVEKEVEKVVEKVPEKVVEKPISQMTVEELKAEIVRITALITQLQVELAQLIGAPVLTLDVNLKYNDSGDDVELLQTWLAKDSGVYPEGLVTGWFGPLTKKAVIRFQKKYADEVLAPWGIIEGTGFVGSTTRDKLNELYGGQ